MRNYIVTLGAIVLAVAIAPSSASARNDQMIERGNEPSTKHGVQGTLDAGGAKMPTAARDFVVHAAQGGMAEVTLGKMAVAQGESPDVKQFGQRMVDDHSKANDELKALAGTKNIEVPSEPDAKDKALAERLSKLSGAEFDRAYMTAMVHDHDHDIAMFKTFSVHGDDADLKQFADKTLPTLEEHGRLAKTTAGKVGVGGKIGSSGRALRRHGSHAKTAAVDRQANR